MKQKSQPTQTFHSMAVGTYTCLALPSTRTSHPNLLCSQLERTHQHTHISTIQHTARFDALMGCMNMPFRAKQLPLHALRVDS
jgi:hypothetical protein